MLSTQLKRYRYRLIELLKYDGNGQKSPLTLFASTVTWTLVFAGKPLRGLRLAASAYRVGWKSSERLAQSIADHLYVSHPKVGTSVTAQFLDKIEPHERTQKFFNNPALMLNGVITVLRNPDQGYKGVLIINYNAYFGPFLKFFDVPSVLSRFHLILEPSWAGFCEPDILAYTQFDEPILVQTYEKRDFRFIHSLNTNLKPLEVGPSWFINHRMFASPEVDSQRDIDVIMVAGWAEFKRHQAFFKSIKPLISRRPDTRIALVGYPVDLSKENIIEMAEESGISPNIKIYEWLKPDGVAELLRRAKCSILWSKFEGNNRAIIESMLCDTPVVMREGHNYGEHYDFINDQTGIFANESNLAEAASALIARQPYMRPRDYIMEHRSCEAATRIMEEAIDSLAVEETSVPSKPSLAVKVNELHGMAYFDADEADFATSYEWLSKQVL